ncbi:MAG: 4-amino-4-deoxychorismate lyase [Hyphomicrobiales bacterium]|nr:MAG: 4-amino-4-deoxychorismate lyase [Hyphomicrobiales bacterium]
MSNTDNSSSFGDESGGSYERNDGSRLVPQSAAEVLQPKQAPAPPKRSRQARHGFVVFLNFVMTLMVLGVITASVIFFVGKKSFEKPGPLRTSQTIVIKEGSGLNQISHQLNARGIIDGQFLGDFLFGIGVKLHGAARSMKAGEYAFTPGMSMFDVMETIRSGKGIVYKITIPEGLTTHVIYQRIAANETLVGDMPEMLPEGSLMPDTYPFQRGTSRTDVVKRMQQSQKQFLAEVWKRRTSGLPVTTPEELVTLASIVEKETGKSAERPHVASVFINRLNQGIRLQSDPTIIYGIFGGEGKPKDRPIYRSDIQNPTPYNTYTIDGLPPGPISSPGRAALEAVANPSITEDLFFVADGTGGHVFSKTLAGHNANVNRWRAIEKRQKEEIAKRAEELAKAAASAAAGDGTTTPATAGQSN